MKIESSSTPRDVETTPTPPGGVSELENEGAEFSNIFLLNNFVDVISEQDLY